MPEYVDNNPSRPSKAKKPWLFAALLLLMGSVLVIAGWRLLQLQGSAYYLIAGGVLVVCGLLLLFGSRWGTRLYGLFFAATVIWAVYESGPDPWALLPRLGLFAVMGLWMLTPRFRRKLYRRQPPALFQLKATWLGVLATTVFFVYLSIATDGINPKAPSMAGTGTAKNPTGNWQHYGATQAGTRFAPFAQINRDNIDQLKVAWVQRTGVGGTFKGTPLQIDNALYLCTGKNVILSLDADSGAERWRFNPNIKEPPFGFSDTCRGVAYFKLPEPSTSDNAVCTERIFTATTDSRLLAVDAHSGKACDDFGHHGEVDLLQGMGTVEDGFYYVTSPPTIASSIVIVGGWVVDNVAIDEPSGVVRGFDPRSGELVWAWDLGKEDQTPALAKNSMFTRGTPNSWSISSADDELGLVYVPTGNATPDYYGGHRTQAMEDYASSIIALEATTGKVRWHYQTTHHDIWDYDVPSQPVLTDVPINGEIRKAVIVPTKRGELFLLDRTNGKPLSEIAELNTPQTDVEGEHTSPTQPFSIGMPSFAGDPVKEKDMWGITPFDQLWCRIQFKEMRYEGPLTPPSLGGSFQYPGFAGGMNWGSVAVDEINHLLVVNSLHLGNHVKLIPRAEYKEGMDLGMGGGTQLGTPYAAYTSPFLSPLFVPCQEPPYGEIAIVDLANQQLLWRRPLGTSNDLGPLGLKTFLPLPMGVFYSGGSLVTQGGLIFIGGTQDSTLRALDTLTGEVLWSERLPTSAQATPMSYISPTSGKQYVVITVPGSGNASIDHNAKTVEEKLSANNQGGYVIAYGL